TAQASILPNPHLFEHQASELVFVNISFEFMRAVLRGDQAFYGQQLVHFRDSEKREIKTIRKEGILFDPGTARWKDRVLLVQCVNAVSAVENNKLFALVLKRQTFPTLFKECFKIREVRNGFFRQRERTPAKVAKEMPFLFLGSVDIDIGC